MRTATIHELKQELTHKSVKEINELCLRLARFKKENKELLTYLLFEAENETAYIQSVKQEIDEKFQEIPSNHNHYFIMKMIRKILRTTKKYIRYSGSDITEIELLLHFCLTLKKSGISLSASVALGNLFEGCIKKIAKVISKLHEDLQFDYQEELAGLN